jgi:hypothetical protein
MQVTISDLKLLDSLIVALDERSPSSPDFVWLKLFKSSIEQRFVTAFHAKEVQ